MAEVGIRPFNESGYEILDSELARGRVTIWSVRPAAPRIGDPFLIESGGRTYDVVVDQVALLKGGWSADCRVAGPAA